MLNQLQDKSLVVISGNKFLASLTDSFFLHLSPYGVKGYTFVEATFLKKPLWLQEVKCK
jgi:hypothetical protein